MSKLFAQVLLSLFIGVGAIVGVDPDARSEVKQILQVTKAAIHQAVDYAMDAADDLSTLANVGATVKFGAGAQTDVDRSQSEADVDSRTEASTEAESGDGFLLNLDDDANAGLDIGLNLGE